jgi:hypothetical protein
MELNDIQSIHFKSLNSATSFSLDVYYAPEFIIDNTPVQDVDYPSLSTKKSTNVFSDYSLGMNLKFHYNNIFVQSGFSFGSFIEDINYNILNELHDTSASYYTYEIKTTHTYDTIGWTDDPLQAGVIVPILRSNINTDTLNSTWNKVDSVSYVLGDKKIENRYKYIEIPLMLGYQHQFGNWKISFGMGAAYGFKVAENGTNTIDNDGFITKITNVKTPYFDNRINGIVSLGLSYSISPQLSLILQPTYRTNLMSANDKSLAYHNFSLRAGLNYKL